MHYRNRRADQFRELLAASGPIALPGAHDVMSAMILEDVGFKCVFLSGYGVAASFMGNPDIGLTSLIETSWVAKNVASRVRVPVVVDADNGYGNEDNVIRTVRELEYAGSAAIVIEDQVLPKRCGHTSDKKILPLPLYMKKLECALRNRETSMCIVARTDSMDLDDAILRAKTFHAAGADVLLIDGLRSPEAVRRVAEEVPGHKQINLIYGGVTEMRTVAEYHKMGFKIIQFSTPTLYVAAKALWTSMKQLQETEDLNSIASMSVGFKEFQGFIENWYKSNVVDPDHSASPEAVGAKASGR